jgi:iron(III) transport system substrate-binding protein
VKIRPNMRSVLRATAVGVLVSLAAACGGGDDEETTTTPAAATPSGATAAAATPPASLDAGLASLYEAAKAKGQKEVVMAISSGSAKNFGLIVSAFNAKFPDVKIVLKEIEFIQMGAVVKSELDSGQRTADIVTNAYLALKPLIEAKSIDETVDWSLAGLSKDRVADRGFVYLYDGACTSVIYNPKFVNASDLPAKLDGFTDPKWNGKLVTQPTNAYACFGFYSLKFGLDATSTLVKSLRSNGLSFSDSHLQQFASGERPVILVGNSGMPLALKNLGAEVGEKVLPGTGVYRTRAALVKGTKVKEAAQLFAAYMTTPEVTKIFETAFNSGFVGDVDSPLTKNLEKISNTKLTDTEVFVFETIDTFPQRAAGASAIQKLVTG